MPQGLNQARPVDPVLEAFSLEYRQAQTNFIADEACPWLQTDGDTGTYYVAEALNNLKWENPAWSYTTGASRVDSRYKSDSFRAQPYGLEEAVSDAMMRNWLQGGQGLKERAAAGLMDRLMIAREKRVEALFDAATPDNVAATWDSSSANPRFDINKGKRVVLLRTGNEPNYLVIPAVVWNSITGTQASGTAGAVIIDAIKYTQAALGSTLTAELVAGYLNVEKVLIGKAVESDNTKAEPEAIGGTAGLAEAGLDIWDKDEFYLFIRREPAVQTVTAFMTLGPDLYTPDTYRDDKVKADIVRLTQTVVEKAICSTAIYCGGNVLT